MKTEYICECGKRFSSSQKYGGHTTHCKQHLTATGKYDFSYHNPAIKEKIKQDLVDEKLNQWIAEKHTCEKCEKVMTEKFGSGRFCSKSCANAHKKSDESKLKVSQTLNKFHKHQKDVGADIRTKNIRSYEINPNRCKICGKPLSYDDRNLNTCSRECSLQLQSITMTDILAEKGLHRTVPKKYKYGTYRGIHCDSSWELAFLIYCLECGKNIRRCDEHFTYTLDNHRHNYFPDFIVDDNYYEIKNYYTETVYAKIAQFPKDKKLIIIDGKQIHTYLNYCKHKYGDNFFYLYDRSFPSWMD